MRLYDLAPRLLVPNVEALRWRFEGYVLTDFDIGPTGAVADVRAIISYPPFVFDAATISGVREFRFLPPRVGSQVLGCQGETQPVMFHLAR